jgi:hypothetical protein
MSWARLSRLRHGLTAERNFKAMITSAGGIY